MYNSFFKFRNRFNFHPHKYDLGRPIFQNRSLEENFFVLKVYQLDAADFDNFYQYQLEYYLQTNPLKEQAFFNHVYYVVIHRINYFKGKDFFSKAYRRGK